MGSLRAASSQPMPSLPHRIREEHPNLSSSVVGPLGLEPRQPRREHLCYGQERRRPASYTRSDMLTIRDIERLIPHRYPFLLVDRVVEAEAGKRIIAIKNVTANEWFFQGHFPGFPIMPGVLIIEALAQTGAVLLLSEAEAKGQIPLFAGIDDCRFRQQVVPGDTLTLEVELTARRGPVGKGRARATVDGKVAAECTLTFALTRMPTDDSENAGR